MQRAPVHFKNVIHMAEAKPETRRIVRILGTDVNGSLSVERALRKIKGVSFMFSRAVCTTQGIERTRKAGTLEEREIKGIENFIKEPQLPKWMLNRRKDRDSGNDTHISSAKIDLIKREDINLLKKVRSYRGIRHELGQPVRGQRTRGTFRTNKAVGVSKKAAKQKAQGGKK